MFEDLIDKTFEDILDIGGSEDVRGEDDWDATGDVWSTGEEKWSTGREPDIWKTSDS